MADRYLACPCGGVVGGCAFAFGAGWGGDVGRGRVPGMAPSRSSILWPACPLSGADVLSDIAPPFYPWALVVFVGAGAGALGGRIVGRGFVPGMCPFVPSGVAMDLLVSLLLATT